MLDLPGNRLIPDKPPFSNLLSTVRGARQLKIMMSFLLLDYSSNPYESDRVFRNRFVYERSLHIYQKKRDAKDDKEWQWYELKWPREIREASNNWNKQKIEVFLHQNNIKWKFNFSGASHVGGVWERMIR